MTQERAGGHQIAEARWLRSQSVIEEFSECWTKGSCDSVTYTHDIFHAVVAASNIRSAAHISRPQLWLTRSYLSTGHWPSRLSTGSNGRHGANVWPVVPCVRLDSWTLRLHTSVLYDAQEYSLPGYVSNTVKPNPDILFPGPDTFRPSLNSYMVANADAIVAVATAVGDADVASKYSTISQNLRQAMLTNLWNSSQQVSVDNIRAGSPGAGQVIGREEVGFYPFRYGIAFEKK